MASAVPCDEKLSGVSVTDQRTGQQDDLVHILDVSHGDKIFETNSSNSIHFKKEKT